jgi:hypothetical protein
MAFPVVATTNSGNDTSGTSHTVNLPGSIASGDLLIVLFANDGNATITWPSGWDQAANALFDTANGTAVRLAGRQRIADGTEGATITVTTSASEWSAHSTLRITGWHGTTVAEAATATGSSTTADPPNLDPAGWASEDTLWIACSGRDTGGADDDDNTAHPTNYTAIHNVLAGTNAGGVNLTSSRRDNAVSAENPGTYTGPTTEEWVAATVAIRPAAAGAALVTPGVGVLDLTGFAPTVLTPRTVTPDVGVLTLDGFAPTISVAVIAVTQTGALTLDGFAPTIINPHTVFPAVGDLTLTGFAPTIQVAVVVQTQTGALLLDGFAPTVTGGGAVAVAPAVGGRRPRKDQERARALARWRDEAREHRATIAERQEKALEGDAVPDVAPIPKRLPSLAESLLDARATIETLEAENAALKLRVTDLEHLNAALLAMGEDAWSS